MKKITFLVAIVGISLLAAACKTSQKNTSTSTANVDPLTKVYDVALSFYSKGGGIDLDGVKKMKSFTQTFAKEKGIAIPEPFKQSWGREGEADYFFDLAGIKKPQRELFKTGIKTALQGNQFHFKENVQPRQKQ